MAIGVWIITGLIVGFLASKLVVRTGHGLPRDLGLGAAGAVLAGLLFSALSTADPADTSVFGLVVTLAGAGAALIVYHTLFPHVRPG